MNRKQLNNPNPELKTFALPAIDHAQVAVFRTGDRYYVLAPNIEYTDEIPDHPMLGWLMKHSFTTIDKPEDCCLSDWDKFWLCVNGDCAFPPHYVVSAASMEDAIEEWTTNCNSTLITSPDLEDYEGSASEDGFDRVYYDCSGRPHDIDQAHIEQLELVLVIV